MSNSNNTWNGTPAPCPIIAQGVGCVPIGTIANQKLRLSLIPPSQRMIIDGTTNASPTIVNVDLVPDIPGNRTPTNTDKRLVIIPISANEYYTIETRSSENTSVYYELGLPIPYNSTAAVINRVKVTGSGPEATVVDIDRLPPLPNPQIYFYCKNHLDGNPNDIGAYWVAGETFWDETQQIEIYVSSNTNSVVNLQVKVKSSNYSTTCW